jgi:hypothetical protein
MDAHGALAPHHVAPGDILVAIDGSPVAAASDPAAVFALLAGAVGTLVTLEFRDASTARRYRVVAQRHTPISTQDFSDPLLNRSSAGQNGTYATEREPTPRGAVLDTIPSSWAAFPQLFPSLPLEQGRAALSQSTATYFANQTDSVGRAGASFSRSPASEWQQQPDRSLLF